MEKKITVFSTKEKTKGDGTPIEGTTKKGGFWKLWSINDKYSFFVHAGNKDELDEKPALEGKTWVFDLEEQTNQVGDKEFTNYTVSNPREIIEEGGSDVNERFDKLAEYLDNKFNEILTAIEDTKR